MFLCKSLQVEWRKRTASVIWKIFRTLKKYRCFFSKKMYSLPYLNIFKLSLSCLEKWRINLSNLFSVIGHLREPPTVLKIYEGVATVTVCTLGNKIFRKSDIWSPQKMYLPALFKKYIKIYFSLAPLEVQAGWWNHQNSNFYIFFISSMFHFFLHQHLRGEQGGESAQNPLRDKHKALPHIFWLWHRSINIHVLYHCQCY